jgi:uncharacterized paraquat-inducible protein A
MRINIYHSGEIKTENQEPAATEFNNKWDVKCCAHCDSYFPPAELKNNLCHKCHKQAEIKAARKMQPSLFLQQNELFT